MALSRDAGALLLTGRDTAQLWDTATWAPLGPPWPHLLDPKPFFSVFRASSGETRETNLRPGPGTSSPVLSPDGKTALLVSADGTARLRGAATGEPRGGLLAHQAPVTAAAFSPDGRTVVTGSEDKTARLWDAGTGEPLRGPLQHQDAVSAVAFSPDGGVVLTGSVDRAARFWDVATGKPLGPPLWHGTPTRLAFSPDGRSVVTATEGGHLRYWDAPPPPLEGAPERVVLWAQTITPRNLDAAGVVGWQKAETWNERRRHLEGLGGSPVPPDDVLAWHRREAEVCLRDWYWHAAAWHLDRLIEADPGQGKLHLDAAQARVELGRHEQVVADCTRAIGRGVTEARAWRYRGGAYLALGQKEKALADFSAAIERDPKDPHAWFGRARTHAALNDPARAIEDYTRAIERKPFPQVSQAQEERGLAHMNLRQWEQADADFSQIRSLKTGSDAWPYHFNRGVCHANLNRVDEAIADYRTGLKLKPDHAEAQRNLDLLLKAKGGPSDQSGDAVAHYNRGNLLRGQNKLDEAIAAYRKAIDIDGNYAEAHFALGMALRSQDQFTDALVALKKGHELGSKRPDWLFPSAQAVKDCERLVELDAQVRAIRNGEVKPKDVAEQLQLAEFCLDRRLTATAAEMYQQALATKPDRVGWFHPARAAILAGCGQGEDVVNWTRPLGPAGANRRWTGCGLTWRCSGSNWRVSRRPGRGSRR
jgi:tetratricopeptide (TPR) repeat protein